MRDFHSQICLDTYQVWCWFFFFNFLFIWETVPWFTARMLASDRTGLEELNLGLPPGWQELAPSLLPPKVHISGNLESLTQHSDGGHEHPHPQNPHPRNPHPQNPHPSPSDNHWTFLTHLLLLFCPMCSWSCLLFTHSLGPTVYVDDNHDALAGDLL